jgi:hypothetical protein
MEKKLEKLCESSNFIIGGRYCLSPSNVINAYVFIVTSVDDTWVRFTFLDGVNGSAARKVGIRAFEFPFSSLEKELL